MFHLSRVFIVGVLVVLTNLSQQCSAQPPVDYAILGQPSMATKLNLTDQQRASVADLLDKRVADFVAAEPNKRNSVRAESDKALKALLTPEQQQTLLTSLTSGKLQFNFHQQKWGAVLRWFAGQSDLALMMDSEPPGLFTYNDTKEFTPSEAIDLLNSVLLSKDFTLIRREKMLIVADTSGGLPFQLVPRVTVEKLAERGRFEVVTTSFALGARPVDVVLKEVTPLVGNHGQVTPLASARKMLVTETAGKLQAINVLIASIPEPKKPAPPPKPKAKPKPPAPIFATYPAPGLDPETTLETLSMLFSDAKVKFDPSAEVVHVFAVPTTQENLSKSLTGLVASVTGDNKPLLQTYSAPAKDIENLVTQLKLAHPEFEIASDPDNNRVLVVANAAGQTAVQATLTELGVNANTKTRGVDAPTVVVHTVDPQSVEPLTVLLQSVIPQALVVGHTDRIAVRASEVDQILAKAAINQFTLESDDKSSLVFYSLKQPLSEEMLSIVTASVPDATVTQLADQKKLSVTAALADHDTVSNVLAQIDATIEPPAKRVLKIYPATAKQQERLDLIDDSLGKEIQEMKRVVDSDAEEIAAWGTDQQHMLLQQLLEQLKSTDKPDLVDPIRLDVAVANPSELIDPLREKFPKTQMVFNEQSSALFVWASDSDFAPIRQEFEKLSLALPAKSNLVVESYDIPESESETITATIAAVVPEATLTTSANGQLVVLASEQDQVAVNGIVQKLAKENKLDDAILIAYPLKKADATAVVAVLSQIQPETTFAADTRANQVLASAALKDQPRLQALIEQLDAEPDNTNDKVVESYTLDSLDPVVALPILQPLFPELTITADGPNGQLMASGTQSDHVLLAAAIERVQAKAKDKKTRVVSYEVRPATASQVQTVLMQLVPNAVIATDVENGKVMAWSDDRGHQLIDQAIKQYQQPTADEARSLKTYPVPSGESTTALATMQLVAPEASLSVDAAGENLIAWGKQAEHESIAAAMKSWDTSDVETTLKTHAVRADILPQVTAYLAATMPDVKLLETGAKDSLTTRTSKLQHTQIAEFIQQLQDQLPKPQERFVRVYPVDIDRMKIAALVDALDEETTAGLTLHPNEETNTLVARGNAEEQTRLQTAIETIIGQLPEPDNNLITEVYRFKTGNPTSAMTVLQRLMPDATIAADPLSSTLVATATQDQQKRIGEVVKQIDSSESIVAVVTKVYPFQRAKAVNIYTAFRTLAPKSRVSYDAGSNVVIATATEEDHQVFAKAAQQLDGVTSANLETKVYRFATGSPLAASTVLATLMPDAKIAADRTASVLVATATPEQHLQISDVVKQIEATEPTADHRTEVYQFDEAKAVYVSKAFTTLAPNAKVGFVTGSNVVIATASDADHKILAEASKQIDGKPMGNLVKVYPLDRSKINTQMLLESIDESLKSSLAIQENVRLNSLIVRGAPEDHDALQNSIDAITTALPKNDEPVTTQVYLFPKADVRAIAGALETLAPNATINSDRISDTVLVTANDDDQKKIAAVIKNFEFDASKDPVVKAYPVRNADANAVYESLSGAFDRSRDFTITYQEATKTLYVIATPRNHVVFSEMLTSLDQQPQVIVQRDPKVYSLNTVDADVAADAIRGLLKGQVPVAEIQPNEKSNSLLVVADAKQHLQIKKALDVLDGQDLDMEVFQLQVVEPWTVDSAVTSLFSELPDGVRPSLSTDFTTGKLFVRGSEQQLKEIRGLLVKLGEPISEEGGAQSGNTRTIAFPGDTNAIALQIESIWPRIRENRIQVITPSNRRVQPIFPNQEPAAEEPAKAVPERSDDAALPGSNATRLVLFQNTTRGPKPQTKTENEKPADKKPVDDNAAADPSAPILMVPGNGTITISSEDTEALDRMESLIRAMAGAQLGRSNSNQSNLAVFFLRNTGASEMQVVLKQLLDEMPSQRGSFEKPVVVSDDRLNALIVHGSKSIRETIRELLEILDTKELPDPLNVYRPEIITLHHTQASRVLVLLNNVYKTQLTSGGGRAQIKIPKGVDSSVASVLQQINTAAAGPVLTLDVDETSNSLIVRAPPELRKEINEFVSRVDMQAESSVSQHVRVIQLERTKSDRMQSVLQQFISGHQGTPAR